jgi:mannosyltransferase OCH1-like enzyme
MKYYYIFIFIIIIYLLYFIIDNRLSVKKIKNENFDNNFIPKIIIQTWKTNKIPIKYKNDIATITNYNKDYQYLFFTDDDIEVFLKENYPEYYKTYIKLPIVIQKIDFFRYIAVYHYGGFYMDLDMKGLSSLDELLKYECVFPVDQNIRHMCNKPRYNYFCKKDMYFLLGQYAFGAKPYNKFIKKLIDTIHHNIDNYINQHSMLQKNTHKYSKHRYVYSSTGPDFVTNVYMDYIDKDNIHILHYPEDQFFGKYAKHNYYGTWK